MHPSSSAALAGNPCPRKRPREDRPNNVMMHLKQVEKLQQQRQQQQQQCFLPTHLSLLRALHADDETAEGNTVNSCPRPSWVEVKIFVNLQESIVERRSQAARVAAVLRALGGHPSSTTTANPTPAGQDRKDHQADKHGANRSVDSTRADQAGGVGVSSVFPAEGKAGSVGSCSRASLFSLEPRSVVCGVLRRAVRNQESDHASMCARLRGLKMGVDNTVFQLNSSLEQLESSRRDRAKPWISRWQGEEAHAHAADVVERYANKLLLWRRLQLALAACRLADDERGGGEEGPGRRMVRMRHSRRHE